jgi:phage shock protein C
LFRGRTRLSDRFAGRYNDRFASGPGSVEAGGSPGPRGMFAGLYRSRRGMIFGVCKGLAESFDVSVRAVRIITVIAFLFTGIWPVGVLYLVAAMLLKPEPVVPFGDEDEREFYDSYAGSPAGALSRLKKRFETLDRRIRRMEDVVTSREFQWQRKFDAER